MNKHLLGIHTAYPEKYSPEILFPISRKESREKIGIKNQMPFNGLDIWNAWEFSWLGKNGIPRVGKITIKIPADSENIVESKSLKLYLSSFTMVQHNSLSELTQLIKNDLDVITQSSIRIDIETNVNAGSLNPKPLPGLCIDKKLKEFSEKKSPEPQLLRVCGKKNINEILHSHLLKSNCPITNQPDTGSLLIQYQGKQIESSTLLRYILSFRQHNDFHESCVEKIFVDIKEFCKTESLAVQAFYSRRGGIDINPFRSDAKIKAADIRTWRQ